MKTAPMAATFDTRLTIVAGLLEEKGLETQYGKIKCLGETECLQRRRQAPSFPREIPEAWDEGQKKSEI